MIADVRRDVIRIALDNAGRNANVFGIGAVIEKQIFAEILQAATAKKADFAWRGIGGYNSFSDRELRDVLTGRDYIAGQLMPEYRGRHNHARMISAAEHLHVGTAGE